MALTFEYAITAVQADCSGNTLTDNTVYGNGELERHQLATYIIAAKMDVEGTPTYITMDNTAPVNTTGQADLNDYVPTTIPFSTSADGWYQFFMVQVEFYTTSSYVAGTGFADCSVVYDTTDGNFYYCVQDNTGGAQPPNTDDGTYWVQLPLTDDTTIVPTNWLSIVQNDNTQVYDIHQHDDIVTCRAENCLVRLLESAVDEGLCKDCNEFFKIKDYMKIDVLVNGANAKNYEDKQSEAEEILRFIEDYCAKC